MADNPDQPRESSETINDSQQGSQQGNQGSPRPSGPTGQENGFGHIIQTALAHYANNKTEALLMVTRMLTILFSFLYLMPFFGSNSFYKKVLIANAATSALRLHQRLPRFQLTTDFLHQLVAEDSCHYLLFSVIFLSCAPITLVLFPIALFATLHVAFAALTLLDRTGNRSSKLLLSGSYWLLNWKL